MTLFRIVESAPGSILIDGIDIGTIGLKDVRSAISIIPQDPVVRTLHNIRAAQRELFESRACCEKPRPLAPSSWPFGCCQARDPFGRSLTPLSPTPHVFSSFFSLQLFSGTIRLNLDPFGQHSDEALWTVLAQVSMKQFVSSLTLGLDSAVAEYGDNYSQGQKQLICIARALLRRSRIIVLDEATASTSSEVDALIQKTIREQFAHCTVLTIAHRLGTIMDSTRILVLDQGHLAEFDTPQNLINKPNGIFATMVKTAEGVKGQEQK